MNTETITNPLATIIEESGLTGNLASALIDGFSPAFNQAFALTAISTAIVVTDATQVTEMKRAREARLGLRAIRIEAEKLRKSMKEDSLRTGKAIDKVYAAFELAVVPEETRLEHAEKFAERAEAERKAKLKASREALLAPFGINTAHYALTEMSEADFGELLRAQEAVVAARVAAAAKAEADRLAAEKAKAEADAKRAAEYAELQAKAKAEAAAHAADMKAARAKADADRAVVEEAARKAKAIADAKLKAEREAREKAEKAIADAKAAQVDKAKAEAEAARKAAAAPDRVKLLAVADALDAIQLPELATEEAHEFAASIETEIGNIINCIRSRVTYL